jgi:hypothetical protein
MAIVMVSGRVNAEPASDLLLMHRIDSSVTDKCRRVSGIWMCFGGGGSYSGYGSEE